LQIKDKKTPPIVKTKVMERNIPRSSLYILLVIGSAVLVQDSVRNALICYLGKLWKDCGNTMQEMWSNFLELVNISIKTTPFQIHAHYQNILHL